LLENPLNFRLMKNLASQNLLCDIKSKLTGLKIDENEIAWGNGVFKNPWIIDLNAQEMLRQQCNELLNY